MTLRELNDRSALSPKRGARRFSGAAERILIASVAALLLVPCFWQPHIMAGDLSSHLYNAWLAGQIQNGALHAPGLSVAHPMTNVLADWAMEALIVRIGLSGTERIVVGAAVEIFFWGAFIFVAVAAGGRCWVIAPSLAMMAYGIVFHMGFLNFYLATGLSLWVLALLWRPRGPWYWLAFPCSALALLAHPVPLAWCAAALLYTYGLRRVPESRKLLVFVAAVCLLLAAPVVLLIMFPAKWAPDSLVRQGVLALTGAGQLWVYGAGYLFVVTGILIVSFFLFLERWDRGSILKDPLFHLWILSVVAYLVLPDSIHFPHYRYPIQFMQLRISFSIAILFCAMVAGGAHGRALTRASAVLAAGFFTMLYLDARSLNRLEIELAGLVSQLPPGERVVTALQDSASLQLNGLVHLGSAACTGRCWDYGNYEPSTGQFRVRATGLNGVVVDNMRKVSEIEFGRHIVTVEEAPLYSVCPPKRPGPTFELRKLAAGETTCLMWIPATKHF